jgi:hypothetical protein
MSVHAAIATVKKRLARAEAERDGWHAAGNEAKYLAASSLVEVLREHLRKLEAATRPSATEPP